MTDSPPPEQEPTPIDEIERGASFVRKNLLWLLGLVPLAFAGLRVIVASGGNAETLKSLVQDLDVSALVLASFLPFLGSVLFWFSLIVAITPKGRKTTSKSGWLFLGSILVVVVWVTMPLSYLLTNIAFVFSILLMALASLLTIRWPIVRKVLVGFAATVIVVAIISAPFVLAGMWLPKERITIAGQDTVIGYVLSSDTRWTKYMDENDEIHIVASSAVLQRESVDNTRAWYQRTLCDFSFCR